MSRESGRSSQPAAQKVDRAQRESLAATVRRFLAGEITAFEFDDQLAPFYDSPDSAVAFVAHAAWFHYDDCQDHQVALLKPEWDYFQRLLLLLESDRQVKTVGRRRWRFSQLVALAALLGFTRFAIWLGWGPQWLVAAIPFGLVSLGIAWTRRAQATQDPFEPALYPFASLADLQSAYTSARFQKTRYPRHLASRRVRSPLMGAALQFQFYAIWLLLSPVVLAVQALPAHESTSRVVPP